MKHRKSWRSPHSMHDCLTLAKIRTNSEMTDLVVKTSLEAILGFLCSPARNNWKEIQF
jgi:hypothetical protein